MLVADAASATAPVDTPANIVLAAAAIDVIATILEFAVLNAACCAAILLETAVSTPWRTTIDEVEVEMPAWRLAWLVDEATFIALTVVLTELMRTLVASSAALSVDCPVVVAVKPTVAAEIVVDSEARTESVLVLEAPSVLKSSWFRSAIRFACIASALALALVLAAVRVEEVWKEAEDAAATIALLALVVASAAAMLTALVFSDFNAAESVVSISDCDVER